MWALAGPQRARTSMVQIMKKLFMVAVVLMDVDVVFVVVVVVAMMCALGDV